MLTDRFRRFTTTFQNLAAGLALGSCAEYSLDDKRSLVHACADIFVHAIF
jgi:hypothetical protein